MTQGTTIPHLFCFGVGYTGRRLGQRLLVEKWQVSGTCREEASAEPLRNLGFSMFPYGGERHDIETVLDALSNATHVLSTVPPSRDHGDPVWQTFGSHISNMKHLEWVGYLSTTGVYGNTDGAEVDETAPTRPSGERGERRVSAEQEWLSLYQNDACPVHVFRLPGIYGPGRSSLDQVRNGNPRRIEKPGHLFNRIHVDDIVSTLIASMAQPHPGAIYNICDDEPAAPGDVTAYACELLNLAPPPTVPFEEARATMSDMALSFWNDNRRVSNKRIKRELGVTLTYPTYRDGLKAILDQESAA